MKKFFIGTCAKSLKQIVLTTFSDKRLYIPILVVLVIASSWIAIVQASVINKPKPNTPNTTNLNTLDQSDIKNVPDNSIESETAVEQNTHNTNATSLSNTGSKPSATTNRVISPDRSSEPTPNIDTICDNLKTVVDSSYTAYNTAVTALMNQEMQWGPPQGTFSPIGMTQPEIDAKINQINLERDTKRKELQATIDATKIKYETAKTNFTANGCN